MIILVPFEMLFATSYPQNQSKTPTSFPYPPFLLNKSDRTMLFSKMADGASSPKRAYTTEEYLKISEEQLKASAAQQQGQIPSVEGNLETQSQPQG